MFSCQHTIELRRKGNKDFSAAQMLDLFFVQQKQLLSLPKQDSCVYTRSAFRLDNEIAGPLG